MMPPVTMLDARRSPLLAVLVALVLACGPEGGTADAVAEQDFAPAAAALVCDLQVQCACADAEPPEHCQGPLEQAFAEFLLPPAGADLQYDAQCARRLLSRYDDVECAALADLDESSECAPCKPHFGDRQRGEACTSFDYLFDDCGPSLSCIGGSCVDPCEPGSLGEACFGRTCAQGLVCSISADPESGDVTSACVLTAGLGESCEEHGCAADLYCATESFECRPLPTLGERCEYSCTDGNWCDNAPPDPDDSLCREKKPDGERCTTNEECINDCDEAAGTCVAATPLVCQISP